MVAANMPTVEVIEHHVISPYPSQPYSGPRREIVLLILGETGVGKSTFINALPNYWFFNSIDEIREDQIINLIPTSFHVFEPGALTKGKLIESGQLSFRSNVPVHFDSDSAWKNEVRGQGQSSTQSPHTYVLDTELSNGEPVTVKFIDTPGMGDTRGVEQDKKNMDNIIQYIANYEKIHGILILLKPNQSRLTTFFRFCVMELLRSLHRECVKNMVFLFTNAQSTNFRPGDTMGSLLPLLEQVSKDSGVKISITRDSVFMVDNEAYRYLLFRNKVAVEEHEREKYHQSWDKSTITCRSVLDTISRLAPHETHQTATLYQVRSQVLELCRPLGDAAAMIVTNKGIIAAQREVLKAAEQKIEKLDEILNAKFDVPVKRPLSPNHRITVCINLSCVQHYQDDSGNTFTKHITRCHDPCHLYQVVCQVIGDPILEHCAAMRNGDCRGCGHSFREHMHTDWELAFETKPIINVKLQEEIQEKRSNVAKIERLIQELEAHQAFLSQEEQRIMEISAKFAVFVKHNGIVLYNDAMPDYLDHLIKDTQQSSAGTAEARKEKIKGLERLKLIYDAERRLLVEGISNDSSEPPSVNEIRALMSQLGDLQFSGQFFKSFSSPNDATHIGSNNGANIKASNGTHIGANGGGVPMQYSTSEPTPSRPSISAINAPQAHLPTPAIRPLAPYTPIYDKPRVGVKEFFSKFKFSRS
ncbi:uncharacterized protein BJ171DRAFT_600575 [Polychytrium aggregatum]|uniref:uncharacterized protein n=1 Tax=Polychytrium aggregatum TaxID=110093 RepID=UPI0022FDD5E3|nr:uncharacterized protein BJ171DRAFT_600575 [Polychytrium aggregatum]KAI9202845.1 hypothetical protein BJ171DRAFT_600575 [Polychytrium aggregatum]